MQTLKSLLQTLQIASIKIVDYIIFNSWGNWIAPEGYVFPIEPRKWEQTKYNTAALNELGKKLLGLEKW